MFLRRMFWAAYTIKREPVDQAQLANGRLSPGYEPTRAYSMFGPFGLIDISWVWMGGV